MPAVFRLLGYRVGAPNAGLSASKNAYCQTRFLRCKKSRRVVCGRLSVGKGFFELLHFAGRCGHVSGLLCGLSICREP